MLQNILRVMRTARHDACMVSRAQYLDNIEKMCIFLRVVQIFFIERFFQIVNFFKPLGRYAHERQKAAVRRSPTAFDVKILIEIYRQTSKLQCLAVGMVIYTARVEQRSVQVADDKFFFIHKNPLKYLKYYAIVSHLMILVCQQ